MADDYLSRLTNDEKGALVALVKRTIAEDRYPFSPRIRPLRDILAKLEPPKLLPRHSLRHFVRLRATRTFIVALLALAIPAFAAETQFVPLQDYIAQPGVEKDLAALGYVADRCTALYLVVAKGLMEETDPERQRFKDFAITTAQKFKGLAVQLMMHGTTIELNDALKRTQQTEVAIGNLYIDRIDAARARAGDMFADPLIAGDFRVCKGLLGGGWAQ